MPKTKYRTLFFTAIMAIIMVYGMIVYNVALNTGGVTSETFLLALHELPIMAPIAFILGILRRRQACKAPRVFVHETPDRPQFITYAVSICICCIMCPIMSLYRDHAF